LYLGIAGGDSKLDINFSKFSCFKCLCYRKRSKFIGDNSFFLYKPADSIYFNLLPKVGLEVDIYLISYYDVEFSRDY